MLAALFGGIWSNSLFMAKLTRKMLATLQEFMVRMADFINVEDILKALIDPRRFKMEEED